MKGFSNKKIRDIQSFNIQYFAEVRSMSYSRWSLQFNKKSLEVFLKGQGAQYYILQYTIKENGMRQSQFCMKPQDIVILLKIIAQGNNNWQQSPLTKSLKMSQSEVSQSVARSKFAGLLDNSGKKVMRQTLMDFLQYGLAVVFPTKPGAVVRGIPTSHSALPLSQEISSTENYVWPAAKGHIRGYGIVPLYITVPVAVLGDEKLHALLALADALRVGRAREKKLAINELKKRIC